MKKTHFILTVIGFAAGTALICCNTDREKIVGNAKENVKQADQDLKNAQAEYDKEWQQFKNSAELKINANEKSIDELKTEIKTAGRKFKAGYEKDVTVLEQKNIELKKNIREYKYEGKDKWEEFKRGFNRDMDIVEKALKDLFAAKD
jgi:phosphoenolpyruvate-protein kinase (PTS system EI component)